MIPLRSIHIAQDRDRVDILTGFQPTHRAIQVVGAICGLEGSQATHVVAPYGAGKSFAALAGISLLTGPPKSVQVLKQKVASSNSTVADSLDQLNGRNWVMLLHGKCRDLADSLWQQIPPPPSLAKN